MKVIMMDIKDISDYENNPRCNEKAIADVAKSIKKFGFQQPIVVDKNNVIIVGHSRKKAAESLGMKKVPVVVAEKLSDAEVRAYRIADNKTSENATWDFSKLNIELGLIPEDLFTGFFKSEVFEDINLGDVSEKMDITKKRDKTASDTEETEKSEGKETVFTIIYKTTDKDRLAEIEEIIKERVQPGDMLKLI